MPGQKPATPKYLPRPQVKGHTCGSRGFGICTCGGGGETPLCDIPSGCCFFTGPWTVTRSSLRMLRRVAVFCRPLRPVLLLVSFPRSQGPVVGVPGLCWMWRDVPFVRQQRPVIGVPGVGLVVAGATPPPPSETFPDQSKNAPPKSAVRKLRAPTPRVAWTEALLGQGACFGIDSWGCLEGLPSRHQQTSSKAPTLPTGAMFSAAPPPPALRRAAKVQLLA